MPVIEDFEKIEIRIGKIIKAENFTKARKPSYKLQIDFGNETGVKNSSAQITKNYTSNELLGKLVVAVTNFPPRKIAGFESQVLVLGVNDENENVTLLSVDKNITLGSRIY
ncbi:tRNA-binding protein [bacterium]|nr:tRNA-binding protein [bacterium]